MSIWKATMLFAAGRKGWTEAFFTDSGSGDMALSRALTLAQARANLLGSGASIVQVVVSLVGSWRTTLAAQGPPTTSTVPADAPEKGLAVRLTANAAKGGGGVQRFYLLRAMPQGFLPVGTSRPYAYPSALLARVQQFLSLLKTGGWMLKGTDKKASSHPVSDLWFISASDGDWFGNPLPPESAENGKVLACLQLRDNASLPLADPATGSPSKVLIRNVGWSEKKALKAVKLNGEHPLTLSGAGLVWVECDAPDLGQYTEGGTVSLRSEQFWPVAFSSIAGPRVHRCGAAPRLLQKGPAHLAGGNPGSLPPGPPGGQPGKGPWNPGPPSQTINNAKELANFVFAGYRPDDLGTSNPVQIAAIVNMPHTWLVTLSGVNRTLEQSTDLVSAILGGIGKDNYYLEQATTRLLAVVDRGDTLFIAGHSLGGLVAQVLPLAKGVLGSNPVSNIVTFGAFPTVPPVPGVKYEMFRVDGDWIVTAQNLAFIINPPAIVSTTIIPPSDPKLSFVFRHMDYSVNPTLEQFNPDGTIPGLAGPRPLILGRVYRFPVPEPFH